MKNSTIQTNENGREMTEDIWKTNIQQKGKDSNLQAQKAIF